MQAKSPETIIKLAVNRMIPRGPLGNTMRTKLKVFTGPNHTHTAQKPIVLEIQGVNE
ncbi:MAG: large subunit ribosomal protein L13 [Candidatus Omnitrophota bacterium]|jgi:large subunit ribosomal protein L13